MWEKTPSQFWNNLTLYAERRRAPYKRINGQPLLWLWWRSMVFFVVASILLLFSYRNEKQSVRCLFSVHLNRKQNEEVEKKAHIHHFIFERWAEFSYINCLDNRSHCVCDVYSDTSGVYMYSALCSHQLNRKILKQWHFQQSLKFHQKPKRYNSSVTIGNGILIEGTKSTLKYTRTHILTLTLSRSKCTTNKKKHPNIIKVKRRWMNKKIETQMYKPKNHNNNNRHNWNKYINDTLNTKSIEKWTKYTLPNERWESERDRNELAFKSMCVRQSSLLLYGQIGLIQCWICRHDKFWNKQKSFFSNLPRCGLHSSDEYNKWY